MSSYTLNFTDSETNKNGIVVEDLELNQETDLTFIGKNYTGYSKYIGENFLHLLENFASSVEPEKPVTGQLWYKTGENPQLMVFDGEWTEANKAKASTVRPLESASNVGDFWIDTALQQLHMFTGKGWVLVGPTFTNADETGFKVEDVVSSSSNVPKKIVSCFVDKKRVAVFSKEEFVPKRAIEGFPTVKTGITLSNIPTAGLPNKFWGISEKAEHLLINNDSVPASRFLRNDTTNTISYSFNIQNKSGINVGPSLETSITSSALEGTVIHQKSSPLISLRTTTNVSGELKTNNALVIVNNTVGINASPGYLPDNISPATLDVNGTAQISGISYFNSNVDSTSISSGSIVATGGVGIGKNLHVGNSINCGSSLNVGTHVLPSVFNTLGSVGTSTRPFKEVHAQSISAADFGKTDKTSIFTGTFVGNLSGTAAALRSPVNFSLTGDVVSNAISTDGTSNVQLTTTIDPDFLLSKPLLPDANGADEVFIHRSADNTGLSRLSIAALFENQGVVPVGAIMPFAGNTAPNGFLICDGSEVSKTTYHKLFSVIGTTFNGSNPLVAPSNFRLPDLRGLFAVGNIAMQNANTTTPITVTATKVNRLSIANGTTAARFVAKTENIVGGSFQVGKTLSGTGINHTATITSISVSADNTLIDVNFSSVLTSFPETGFSLTISSVSDAETIGNVSSQTVTSASSVGASGGNSTVSISVSNLPNHEHTLQDANGQQHYAVRLGTSVSGESIAESIQTDGTDVYMLPSSGPVNSTSLNQPVNIVNPFLSLNYIIFAGVNV